jgi:hypothetical protein
MASQKEHSDSVKMNEIHDTVSENYTKLSDEFAKSQQRHIQAISGLQQEYLESMKVAVKTTISVQKEYFSNSTSRYPIPNTATMQMDNMINQSNEYTTNMIKWVNIQNQFMVNAIEALKEYVKNCNSAIVNMAEYYSNIIKSGSSSVSNIQ